MKRKFLIFIIILFVLSIYNLTAAAQSELAMSIRNHLIVIEEHAGEFPEGEDVRFYQELSEFYDQRHHRSIWFEDKEFKRDPDSLVKEIKNSYDEGLNPEDYHLEYIEELINEEKLFASESRGQRALLDILLTNAYISLASDYLNGKIDAEIIIDDDNYQADSLEAQNLLELLIEKNDISETLQEQLPETENLVN
ncbi:MAG: hypothetical protein ACOCXB_04235 [Halanaerobium sp.]